MKHCSTQRSITDGALLQLTSKLLQRNKNFCKNDQLQNIQAKSFSSRHVCRWFVSSVSRFVSLCKYPTRPFIKSSKCLKVSQHGTDVKWFTDWAKRWKLNSKVIRAIQANIERTSDIHGKVNWTGHMEQAINARTSDRPYGLDKKLIN